MTATADTTDATSTACLGPTDTVGQSGPKRRRGLRAAIVTLSMLVMSIFGTVFTTSSASAATGVSYCFVDLWGQRLPLLTTSVYMYTAAGWTLVAYDKTGTTGCSSINVSRWSNYYLMVRAGTFTDNIKGQTPLMALPGSGQAYLGTGTAWR